MLSVQALVAVNFFLCIVLLLSVVLGADFERRGSPHDVLKLRSTGYNNDKPSAAFSRRAGGFFSTTATPLIAANQTQSSAHLRNWNTFNRGRIIDFKPVIPGNCILRLKRRSNVATIGPRMLHDFNLDGLYYFAKYIFQYNRSVLPFPKLRSGLDSLVMEISSAADRPSNTTQDLLPVTAVMDVFESLQELTHHLAVQEMDFELYYENITKPGTEMDLVASGCLAFDNCGSVQPNGTLKLGNSSHSAPNTASILRGANDAIFELVDPGDSPSIPKSIFADQTCRFYRQLLQYTLGGEGPTLPKDPDYKHDTQTFVKGFYNNLIIAVGGQYVWFVETLGVTVTDVADLLHFYLQPKVADGTLKIGTRGSIYRLVYGDVPFGSKVEIGDFCAWYSDTPNACDALYTVPKFTPRSPLLDAGGNSSALWATS